MGQPMARRLAQAGFSVIGFNRTRSRAEALLSDGVEVADTPEQACGVDLLISMVSDDEAVEQLFWRGGRFLTMNRPGLVHAGMSTISDTLAVRRPHHPGIVSDAGVSVLEPHARQTAPGGRPSPRQPLHQERPDVGCIGGSAGSRGAAGASDREPRAARTLAPGTAIITKR